MNDRDMTRDGGQAPRTGVVLFSLGAVLNVVLSFHVGSVYVFGVLSEIGGTLPTVTFVAAAFCALFMLVAYQGMWKGYLFYGRPAFRLASVLFVAGTLSYLMPSGILEVLCYPPSREIVTTVFFEEAVRWMNRVYIVLTAAAFVLALAVVPAQAHFPKSK